MKVLRTWNFSVFGSENDEVIPVIGSYIKNVKMLFFCVFKSASPLVRGKDSKKNILIVFISKNEKISKKRKKTFHFDYCSRIFIFHNCYPWFFTCSLIGHIWCKYILSLSIHGMFLPWVKILPSISYFFAP